jgi:hypothetical protein
MLMTSRGALPSVASSLLDLSDRGHRGWSIQRKVIGVANRSRLSGKCRLWLGGCCGPRPVKRAIHIRLRREQSPPPRSKGWR